MNLAGGDDYRCAWCSVAAPGGGPAPREWFALQVTRLGRAYGARRAVLACSPACMVAFLAECIGDELQYEIQRPGSAPVL